MKELPQSNHLSDGSQYYGNGVWGPSTADLERSNLSFNEKPKTKEEPNNHLLFIAQESVFGRFFQTASKIKLPAKFAIPVGLAVAVLATACGSRNSEKSKLPSTPRPSESSAPPNPENPLAVLGMPFPKDSKMRIQQAWTSNLDPKHHGIDFIKGDLDNSRTWQSFPVHAAATGLACANPPSRQGEAVFVTHFTGDNLIGSTYYGHLKKIEKDIPACEKNTPKFKKQGEKLGDAGSTGTPDAAWIHLHFAVKDANQNPIDPYGLKKERDVYPDPNFKNGNPCGPNALFIDCYPKGVVVAVPKDPPIAPFSGKATSKEVFPATPPPTPFPTAIPTPKPTETPKPVEKKVFISKKPEELFRALLTNPISSDILPQGMTSRGALASEIDATGKALKQVGAVNIKIEDSVSTSVRGTPNGIVFYGIFPDASGAKSASELIATHLGNGQVLKDFPYLTMVYNIESAIGGVIYTATTVLVTSVENVTVATSLTDANFRGTNVDLIHSRAISLAKAAIEHLKKVGQ